MKKTDTKTKTEPRCHCGSKTIYRVKIDYVWRGTVSTPDGKTIRVFSRANQTAIDLLRAISVFDGDLV